MSDDDEPSLPTERTEQELEERHACELEEMHTKMNTHVEAAKAAAGKGKKAKEKIDGAEREAESWKYKLTTRQQAEMDLLQEHLAGGAGGYPAKEKDPEEKAVVAAAEPEIPPQEDEAEIARRKKEKAMKKKQNKAGKEADREAEREREKREAGPSQRLLESLSLSKQLSILEPPMRVQEVAADGHCLYRSIGEQLNCVRPELHKWARELEHNHEEVRALCAQALRKRVDDYAPFAELKDGEDFDGYCSRVEHSGDWGGHLELRALSDELGVRIVVHRAEESEMVLGEARGAPLQVAYHRHYYALGEHYNSVVASTA